MKLESVDQLQLLAFVLEQADKTEWEYRPDVDHYVRIAEEILTEKLGHDRFTEEEETKAIIENIFPDTPSIVRKFSASIMAKHVSEAKRNASITNGKKGGRPPKAKTPA